MLSAQDRYRAMQYRRSGRSGLLLPAISLGLWHNFGGVDAYENARRMAVAAFDVGIIHLDLANNYGPPPGSAEETLGRILRDELGAHRDELVISSKAGYRMHPGPYGDWGSRKYLVQSCEASLRRLGLDHVDIFYHHRPDPETPLAETMQALDFLVRSGKALYVGLSNYPPAIVREAAAILRRLGTPCTIHQPPYSMLNRRWEQEGLFETLAEEGIGCICFSPLAQGLLSDRYLNGVPQDSRAAKPHGFLKAEQVDPTVLAKVRRLKEIAAGRSVNMAQLALLWVLRRPEITSALIGASRVEQITEAAAVAQAAPLNADEIARIEAILLG